MVYFPWKVLRAGNGRVGQVLVWRWEGQVLTLGTSLYGKAGQVLALWIECVVGRVGTR